MQFRQPHNTTEKYFKYDISRIFTLDTFRETNGAHLHLLFYATTVILMVV